MQENNKNCQEFIQNCLRTKSDKFYGKLVGKSYFLNLCCSLINFGNLLDECKKALFYGREYNNGKVTVETLDTYFMNNQKSQDILHGVIGAVTESIELLENIITALHTNQPIDTVNLVEEIGDISWYQAIILASLDKDFSDCNTKLLNKLKIRFPEKFTEEKANNRDLEKERKTLEA
jgi:hypothetical protein